MFKRDLKLFWRCLRSAFALLILLVTLCALAAGVIVQDVGEAYTPIQVAIVDNEDSVFSRILVRAVGNMAYIADLLVTERMEEAEARAALYEGRCAAVIILPEGFTEDIMRGREAQGTIILSPALQAQSSLVASVARFGEQLLAAGQYGVFCGERLLSVHRLDAAVREQFYADANAGLLGEATSAAGRYFRIETLDYLDTGMSSEACFALYWTVALLFLVSLFFVPLFETDCTRPMLSRLFALGVRDAAFLRWKLILLFAFRVLLLAAAAAVMMPTGLMACSFSAFAALVLTAAYVTVIGACLTMCFGDGLTANILFAVVGLFLCGGLVPRQMLPTALLRIGALTPFGAAGALLAPAFGAAPDAAGILAAVVYAVAALICVRVRLLRVRTGRGSV